MTNLKQALALLGTVLFVSLSFSGCAETKKQPSGVSAVSGGSSSAVKLPEKEETQTSSVSQKTAMKTFIQYNTAALEGYEPTLWLMENGSFEFAAQLYDGTVLLSGSYTEQETEYVLTVTDSASPAVTAESVGEIRLEKTEAGVLYRGATVGLTADGSEFSKKD